MTAHPVNSSFSVPVPGIRIGDVFATKDSADVWTATRDGSTIATIARVAGGWHVNGETFPTIRRAVESLV